MNFDKASFSQDLRQRKEYVDSCLKKFMAQEETFPPAIHKAMYYSVFNGGKRLRPILVLEGAALAGGKKERAVPIACAIEMIHSYSLVHDDLPAMDDDDFRRGKPTCHKVFGEALAILAGDALLTAAFGLMAGVSSTDDQVPAVRVLKVIEEIAAAAGSQGMIGGQVLDLEHEGRDTGIDTLRKIHCLKTGELFRTSIRAGAIIGGMEADGIRALDNYAANFGLAFQISDDILDVNGNEEIIGKPVGSDQRNQKTTFPSLLGMEKSQQILQESVNDCIDSLKGFGPEANFLRNLAYYLLHRDN
ncbi:MAG: polyprenyl synthetase family protein [Syntrophomonadaceae bacterium]